MHDDATRLERALEVFLAFRGDAAAREELLRAHADLRDLLEPMFEGEAPDAAPSGDLPRIEGFRIVRELGRGGMGVVYEARQQSLDRTVALKVLAPHLASDAASIARARREARVLAHLDHPAIVKVLDVGGELHRHWVAMEFVDGKGLDVVLRERAGAPHTRASLRALVRMLARIADAVAHAHEAGVIHRDIKPGNILVRADGSAVLTDFGLAREEDTQALTRHGAITGTPAYMAPERLTDGIADVRGDVFSLGVTLFESCTLQHPFGTGSLETTMQRILAGAIPEPRQLAPLLPRDLAAILARALERSPQQRYPSARALAEDLEGFLAGRPISARPVTSAQRLLRWTRREPWRAGLLTALLLAVPAIAALSGFLWAQREAVDAGEVALRRDAYDALVARAANKLFDVRHDPTYRDDVEAAHALDPTRPEAVFVAALGVASDSPRAVAEIDASELGHIPGLRRLRALHASFAAGTPAVHEALRALGPPVDPFDALMDANARYECALRDGDRAALRAAAVDMGRSERFWPTSSVIHAQLWAAAAATSGDQEQLIEALDTLDRVFPNILGACLTVTSHPDRQRALAAARRAVALEPGYWLAHYNLAVCLHSLADYPAALAAAEEAVRLEPKAVNAVTQRATDLFMVGRADESLAAFEQLVTEHPSQGPAWHNLGALRARKGDEAGAIEALQQAVRCMPDNPVPSQALEKLLREAGRAAEADAEAKRRGG
jgi:tetratricopeptide (TPR) repeat protein